MKALTSINRKNELGYFYLHPAVFSGRVSMEECVNRNYGPNSGLLRASACRVRILAEE